MNNPPLSVIQKGLSIGCRRSRVSIQFEVDFNRPLQESEFVIHFEWTTTKHRSKHPLTVNDELVDMLLLIDWANQ
jgi:hypothetical protein